MKFYVVVIYYLVSLSLKFHEDPESNVRARIVNAHTRDKMIKRTPVTAYMLLLSLSNKLILFDSHYESPCISVEFEDNNLVCHKLSSLSSPPLLMSRTGSVPENSPDYS